MPASLSPDLSLTIVVVAAWAGFGVVAALGIVLHEACHVGVGRLVGFRIHEVVFGRGPVVRAWWVGSVLVTLHRWPLAGLVRWELRGTRWLRTRLGLAIAAGPLANVALAAAMLPWFLPLARAGMSPTDVGGWFVFAAGLTAMLRAAVGWLPFAVGDRVSDAHHLVRLPWRDADWARAVLASSAARARTWDVFGPYLRGDLRAAEAAVGVGAPDGDAARELVPLLMLARGDAAAALAATPPPAAGADGPLSAHAAINRVMLSAYVADAGAHAEATALVRSHLAPQQVPRELAPAAARARGALALVVGDVPTARRELALAGRGEEPHWLAAWTASLAAGIEAAAGDEVASRRWSARAARLFRADPLRGQHERRALAALAAASGGPEVAGRAWSAAGG